MTPRGGLDRRNHIEQMVVTVLNALLEGAQQLQL